MADFFHMGGYAFYVWLSYGIGAVVLIMNVILPKLHARQVKRELEIRIAREENNASST